jgi:two-component system, OmpR family, response regulator
MGARALVVEVGGILRNSLTPFFQQCGLDIYGASSLQDARALIQALKPAVTILDRDLTDGDGLQLVPEAVGAGAHALVVSEHNEASDRIEALTLGAHEYLGKPAHPEEVYLRVRNMLSGQAPVVDDAGTVRVFGGVRVDLLSRAILRADGARGESLTESEFAILRALAENTDQIVSREMLREAALGETGDDQRSRAVDTCVSRLRVKLRSADVGVEIRSVRQAGYLFRRQRSSKAA